MGIEEMIRSLVKQEVSEIVKQEVSTALAKITLNDSKPLPDEGGYDFAADVTGLSVKYIYNLKSKGLIPHKTWGGKPRFSRQELVEWMQEGMPSPLLQKASERLAKPNR